MLPRFVVILALLSSISHALPLLKRSLPSLTETPGIILETITDPYHPANKYSEIGYFAPNSDGAISVVNFTITGEWNNPGWQSTGPHRGDSPSLSVGGTSLTQDGVPLPAKTPAVWEGHLIEGEFSSFSDSSTGVTVVSTIDGAATALAPGSPAGNVILIGMDGHPDAWTFTCIKTDGNAGVWKTGRSRSAADYACIPAVL